MFLGDCKEQLKELPDNYVDSIVTDPPYGINFMGKKWDYDVPTVEMWEECLRVLKPGGHLLSFAGTRTQHRMCVNIEDAGFEIRDMIAWVYGSGFPKSLDISKAIDKAAGAEREVVGIDERYNEPSGIVNAGRGPKARTKIQREITTSKTDEAKQWEGWGTAIKPSLEPITLARKPFKGTVAANVLKHGTGGLNIGESRVGTEEMTEGRAVQGDSGVYAWNTGVDNSKPNENPTTKTGRFPANLIHDGSEEVLELFPEVHGAGSKREAGQAKQDGEGGLFGVGNHDGNGMRFGDSGSAARFFYCAKTDKNDRNGTTDNNHPTVKPKLLMKYLVRLVTPKGGIVLDPFMGSGSTGKAAALCKMRFVGVELEEETMEVAKQRIKSAYEYYKH
ncbi:site-specific DNA-methyltransferase [bacterium]|nr:site-specific DNA-methyltransferase [bacterium]